MENGPPRGGLHEYERETRFSVVDRLSGETVKTFTGLFESTFDGSGSWGDGRNSGVQEVAIDEGGRWAFAIHANRMVEAFPLSAVPVPGDPALPWRSAGLPVPVLPMTVDGFVVDDATDFPALATRVAGGWVPTEAAPFDRQLPLSWLCDLYLRLNGLAAAVRLSGVLARWAGSRDESERGAALCFFCRVPHAPGRERVLEAVRSAGVASAVRASPVKYGQGSLEYAPIDVFAAALDTDRLDGHGRAVLVAFREALLAPTASCKQGRLEAFARHDPEWLCRNAPAVVRACPGRLAFLLDALYHAGRSDLLAGAGVLLAASPETDRVELEAWLTRAGRRGLDLGEIRSALDAGQGK